MKNSKKLLNHNGLFLFPKSVLLKHKILSGFQSKGKMGIRVYPIWENNLNKTAIKTQKWQLEYFLDLSIKTLNYKKLEAILKEL